MGPKMFNVRMTYSDCEEAANCVGMVLRQLEKDLDAGNVAHYDDTPDQLRKWLAHLHDVREILEKHL